MNIKDVKIGDVIFYKLKMMNVITISIKIDKYLGI